MNAQFLILAARLPTSVLNYGFLSARRIYKQTKPTQKRRIKQTNILNWASSAFPCYTRSGIFHLSFTQCFEAWSYRKDHLVVIYCKYSRYLIVLWIGNWPIISPFPPRFRLLWGRKHRYHQDCRKTLSSKHIQILCFFSYASSSTPHPRQWASGWVVVSTSVASRLASLFQYFSWYFYRTHVYMGSDLWVLVSVTDWYQLNANWWYQ